MTDRNRTKHLNHMRKKLGMQPRPAPRTWMGAIKHTTASTLQLATSRVYSALQDIAGSVVESLSGPEEVTQSPHSLLPLLEKSPAWKKHFDLLAVLMRSPHSPARHAELFESILADDIPVALNDRLILACFSQWMQEYPQFEADYRLAMKSYLKLTTTRDASAQASIFVMTAGLNASEKLEAILANHYPPCSLPPEAKERLGIKYDGPVHVLFHCFLLSWNTQKVLDFTRSLIALLNEGILKPEHLSFDKTRFMAMMKSKGVYSPEEISRPLFEALDASMLRTQEGTDDHVHPVAIWQAMGGKETAKTRRFTYELCKVESEREPKPPATRMERPA